MPGSEKPCYLTAEEGESLMDPFGDTRVLDVDDSTYSALRKLQTHQASFGGDETLAVPEGSVAVEGRDGEIMEDFFFLITEMELPEIDEGMNLQSIVHQHTQNVVSSLNNSVRHKNPPLRVMNEAVKLAAMARVVFQMARDVPEEEWSG